jgi:hypothetical protein
LGVLGFLLSHLWVFQHENSLLTYSPFSCFSFGHKPKVSVMTMWVQVWSWCLMLL